MSYDPKSYLYDNYIYKCKVCGKDIYIPCAENWAYKRKRHKHAERRTEYYWFCSWHCISEFDKTQKKMTAGRFATQKC